MSVGTHSWSKCRVMSRVDIILTVITASVAHKLTCNSKYKDCTHACVRVHVNFSLVTVLIVEECAMHGYISQLQYKVLLSRLSLN